MNKFFILLGALAILLGNAACSGVPFVSVNEPTATATRRIRPTFTPKPRATPTEIEPTEEPEPTDEPQPTDEPATETPVPVTKAATKPPAPKATKPPEPTVPPKPQFAMNVTSQFICEQEGIFEVVVNVKKGKAMVEGITFAAFDAGGRLLQDGAGNNLVTATYPVSVSTAGNCKLSGSFENPVINNGKLDVGDAVRAGANRIIIRFVKSAADLTPISPDIPIDFGKGGRYWIYTQQQ